MKNLKYVVIIVLVLLASSYSQSAYAQVEKNETWIPVAIHMSTTITDGSLSFQEIIDAARDKGIKAVIFTDRDFMRWEYGLWPIRNLIKRRVEMSSVFKYGFDKYFREIELESNRNPDMIIIAGVESAPYYLWSGIPFTSDFKISDWHKHILVIGLQRAQDYLQLPVISNNHGLKRHFGARPGYDQYHDAGVKPYQALFDYVNAKGGMTFWAHPEAVNIGERDGIKVETDEHIEDLENTDGYTGFAIFYEGYKKVGRIGGVWDELLTQYCRGKRKTPVWAVAGLAFDQGTRDDLKKLMDDARTYVLAGDLSRQGVLDAMRRGRMIVSRGEPTERLLVESFVIKDSLTGKAVTVGETIELKGRPIIAIKAAYSNVEAKGNAEVRLVKDGSVLKVFQTSVPFDIAYEDISSSAGKGFYRLEIRNGDQLIVSNPIFVSTAL